MAKRAVFGRTATGWHHVTILCLAIAGMACGRSQSDVQRDAPARVTDATAGCSAIHDTTAGSGSADALAAIDVSHPDPGTPDAVGADTARPPLLLVLNVPAFRLDVIERGRLAREYRVAVGMRQYPTPIGAHEITSIEWNPWWFPPPSEWARGSRATPPGPGNPMGRVKLQFRPYYLLHGTPDEASIGTASSHGCVRMHNVDAIALARTVSEFGSRPISDATVDTLVANAALTRRYALPDPVPLVIRYDVVELRGDSLWIYPDIYRLSRGEAAGRALSVLRDAGYDTAALDTTLLRVAIARASARPFVVAVEELSGRAAIGERPPR